MLVIREKMKKLLSKLRGLWLSLVFASRLLWTLIKSERSDPVTMVLLVITAWVHTILTMVLWMIGA